MPIERLSGPLPIRRDVAEFDERGPLDWEDNDTSVALGRGGPVPRMTLPWSAMLLGVMLGLVVWTVLGLLAFWLVL